MKLLNEMKLVHVSYQRVWNIHKDERELYIKILLENEETVIDEIKECAFPHCQRILLYHLYANGFSKNEHIWHNIVKVVGSIFGNLKRRGTYYCGIRHTLKRVRKELQKVDVRRDGIIYVCLRGSRTIRK